jgi:hypothetical protein
LVLVDLAEFILRRRDGPVENAIRIDVQFASGSDDTLKKLLRILARFERPGLTFRRDMVGDNAFADDRGFVILFSRANLIVLIRNLTQPIELLTFARFIDALILEI